MQIFSLCILLSSLFIYNSMGAIDEQAIDELHLVAHLAKHIHARSEGPAGGKRGEEDNLAALAQYFPALMWVLRDFHLKLADDAGRPISEKQYLEHSLSPGDLSQPRADAQRKLRDVLRDLFRKRDCVTLQRPAASEEELRHLQSLPYEQLRPKFREQVQTLVEKVFETAEPKAIDGAFVSGPALAALAEAYCKAINSSAVPEIQATWTAVVQQQIRASFNQAWKHYKKAFVEAASRSLPLEEVELKQLHEAEAAEASKMLSASKFGEHEPRFVKQRDELLRRIKEAFEDVEVENISASKHLCERLAEELYSSRIESKLSKRGSYRSLDQLEQDWEELLQEYSKRAIGPAKEEILSDWLLPKRATSLERVGTVLGAAVPPGERSGRGFQPQLRSLPQSKQPEPKLADATTRTQQAREAWQPRFRWNPGASRSIPQSVDATEEPRPGFVNGSVEPARSSTAASARPRPAKQEECVVQ